MENRIRSRKAKSCLHRLLCRFLGREGGGKMHDGDTFSMGSKNTVLEVQFPAFADSMEKLGRTLKVFSSKCFSINWLDE